LLKVALNTKNQSNQTKETGLTGSKPT
jgi:hypothetical protein